MNYFVYIIYSKTLDKYYKGYTKNIKNRLLRHNLGHSTYTKSGVPWKLVLIIKKPSKSEAIILERKLKNLNRERLILFIEKYKGLDQEE